MLPDKNNRLNTQRIDDKHAVEIDKGLFWLGFADYEAGFSNNPYLLLDEDEAVLFDPGPGHPIFREMILQKIQELIPPDIIKYIIVQHQDPDLCALIPLLENHLSTELVIITTPRTALFLPYYGIRKRIYPVGNSDCLELKSGRRIRFYFTPFVHYAGAMVCFDEQTGTLFSSDIFGVFDRNWQLFADDSYVVLAKQFLEHYVGSKKATDYLYKLLKTLEIKRILPQHGGIIDQNIDKFIEMVKDVNPGYWLDHLDSVPSDSQNKILLDEAIKWLKMWTNQDVSANSLQELQEQVIKLGPASVSIFFDIITRKAHELGVKNPLATGRVHTVEEITAANKSNLIDTFRRRLLKSQYSMLIGNESNLDVLIQKRLHAIKDNLVILFVDIRKFTKWSASRPADEVIGLLHREHELVANIINTTGGRINKVIGDGILAYYTVNRLTECVLACFKINKTIIREKLLPVGIGCDMGEVIMGDIGEELRLDFTLIGQTVNFASRLCDEAKENELILSKDLFDNLPEPTRDFMKKLPGFGEISVKRKAEDPVRISIKVSFAQESRA